MGGVGEGVGVSLVRVLLVKFDCVGGVLLVELIMAVAGRRCGGCCPGCRWWCSIADLGGRCCAGRWLGVFLVGCELGCC